MQSYIDVKYVNIISPYLQQFKKKGDFLWNFRCPYCGDSQKSRTKARGFIYRKKNDLFYKCHNCGVGTTLGNLIEHLDSKTHKDYIMERYKKGVKTNNPEPEFHLMNQYSRKVQKGKKWADVLSQLSDSSQYQNFTTNIPLGYLLNSEDYLEAHTETYFSAPDFTSIQTD